MSKLLIETNQDVDPVDDSGLFYAKPVDIEQATNDIKSYILRCRFHSGLDFAEEITEQTALNTAIGIINILTPNQ